MNVEIRARVHLANPGISARLRIGKTNVSKTEADAIVRAIKGIIPTTEGEDNGQVRIKLDGKVVFNQKLADINASKLDVFVTAVQANCTTNQQ